MSGRILAIADFLDAAGWCVATGLPGRLWISERARASLNGKANDCRTWTAFLKFARTIPDLEMEVLDPQSRIAIWKSENAFTAAPPPNLTPRETEIQRLLISGKTSAEISIILGCKPRTVETHVANLYRKVGVRSRTSLILSTQRSSTNETPAA